MFLRFTIGPLGAEVGGKTRNRTRFYQDEIQYQEDAKSRIASRIAAGWRGFRPQPTWRRLEENRLDDRDFAPDQEKILHTGVRMRLWFIWAMLAVLWALQAAFAALIHHTKPAVIMAAMSAFFALMGSIVRRRTLENEARER